MKKNLAVLVLLWSSVGAQASQAVQVCEELIKARLKAPAGYQQVEARETTKKLSIGEWWAQSVSLTSKIDDDQKRREAVKVLERQFNDLQAAGAEPALYTVTVSFDAPNSFNAPMRNTASCRYISPDGTLNGLSAAAMDLWFQ